jgi:hypothetical protein
MLVILSRHGSETKTAAVNSTAAATDLNVHAGAPSPAG